MPLLYDRSVINGEMRFLQVYFKPDVVSIFERDMGADPINRQCLAQSIDGRISGLSWSPDGSRIAYRLMEASGRSGIYAISTESKQSSLVVAGAIPEDQIGWSPDSRRFAFAMTTDGNTDIFVRDDSGDLERITSFSGVDKSPSWSKDGKELVFSSELSGRSEIWLKNLETGALKQVTANGGNSYPSLSPDGKYIAWIRDGEGLFIYERGTGVTRQAASPKQVHFTPAWSPDGKFIAVTALDWGKADIYMLPADGSDALLLTKSILPAAAPTWNPDGSALAAITIRDKRMEILVLTGIEPYKERLMNPIHINVFELARIQ